MPRNVRNFWLDGKIDGRDSAIDGGPKNKEGGFYLNIMQRDDGEVTGAVRIEGLAKSDGTLELTVIDAVSARIIHTHITKR